MNRFRRGRLRYLTLLWLAGITSLAIATAVCVSFGLTSASTGCVYLIIVVMVSLADSFVSSALLSAIAVGCLDYFFIAPRYQFQVANTQDFITLAAFLITSIVITTLVRRLRALGLAHAEQAHLLDLTQDCVLVRDRTHAITFWNRGGEELYGWSRAEAVGKVAHTLLQTTFPLPLEQIEAALLRDGHWEGELQHRTRSGAQRIVASRWSVQRDEHGAISGTLESNTDVTARRRAEEKVRRTQETYLAEAQQLSHTGSFSWNLARGDVFLSDEGRRIFGLPADEPVTLPALLSRFHPEAMQAVRQAMERAAQAAGEIDFEHRLLLPSGAVKHVKIVARPIENADGADLVGALMDVTAIRVAEAALRTARSELAHVTRVSSLGELTASIAHEVNQPLGAVVANAEACLGWLDREEPDLKEARAAIGRIVSDGLRAGEVVRRVRALVKRTDSDMTPTNLNDVIPEAMALLRHELERSGVAVSMELATEPMVVLADRIQIQQVVINLAMNAIEAMQTPPERARKLVIRSHRTGPQAHIAITDNGIGIPRSNSRAYSRRSSPRSARAWGWDCRSADRSLRAMGDGSG